MSTLVHVIHVLACVFLVLAVMVQSGKGAEISASFAGSSQTVFGSSGAGNFFTKTTSILAAVFMVTSIVLTIMGNQSRKSLFDGAAAVPAQSAPAQSAPAQPAVPAQPVTK